MARRRGAVTKDVDDGPALITLDVLLQVAIVGFAAVAMFVVLYGIILYYHGDNSGAHVWPWDWGKR